jgi:hypothetical protein
MVRIDDLLTGGGNVLFPRLYDDIPLQEYGLGGQLSITVLREVGIQIYTIFYYVFLHLRIKQFNEKGWNWKRRN